MNIRKFKWIFAFAGAIAVVLLLRGFAFTSCLIPSTGMENSLFQGERILVNKWSYGLRVPLMSLFSYHRWCERSVRQQDVVVFNNPAAIGQPTIDRREIYISRCIGTPGDTLLVDSLFSVSSPEAQFNPDKKRLYSYPATKEQLITSLMQTLSITNDGLMGSNDSTHVRSFSRYEYYLLEQAISDQNWIQPLTEKSEKELKPLIVPGKGKQAEIKNDTLYIDGKPTQHCFFTKDYYWMASNNSVNLSDSRLFGFVPQDHIIGKASLIWFSKEKGTGIFDGYRWNRFFQSVK